MDRSLADLAAAYLKQRPSTNRVEQAFIDLGAPRGIMEHGNIDLHSRPIVRNPDGSISTVRSTSMNFGNGEVLLPTVSDDGRNLSLEEVAEMYRRSGRHLGVFNTPDNATDYAKQLSAAQAKEYGGRR
jgi:hypothetical protein